jgi:hypothetical protein
VAETYSNGAKACERVQVSAVKVERLNHYSDVSGVKKSPPVDYVASVDTDSSFQAKPEPEFVLCVGMVAWG